MAVANEGLRERARVVEDGALTKITNASEEVEYDRAKREFETLEMDASESVAEFFTRVHIILMELERHQIPIPAREIQRVVLGSLSPRFPNETSMHAYKGECDLKDLETGLAWVEKFRLDQIKKGASPHALTLPIQAAAERGLEVAPVDEASAQAGARASAKTMVAMSNNSSSSSSHPHGSSGSSHGHLHGSSTNRLHGSSTSSSHPHGTSSSNGHLHSNNSSSEDHDNSSPTHGPAGRARPLNSDTGAECPIKGDNSIREEGSRAGSVPCVSGAARMNISPLSAGQLHAPQHHSIASTRHYLTQEHMPRSTAHPLQRGQRTTVMDIPRLHPATDHPHRKPATDLPHRKPAIDLPRQCHDRLDLTDHLHRRPNLNPTGASHPANPRLCRHNMCHQASFRVRI